MPRLVRLRLKADEITARLMCAAASLTGLHCVAVLCVLGCPIGAKPSNCNVNCCILLKFSIYRESALCCFYVLKKKGGELRRFKMSAWLQFRVFITPASRSGDSPPWGKVRQTSEYYPYGRRILSVLPRGEDHLTPV